MSGSGSKGTVLFGGSGFMGPYILNRDPSIISVGRRPPAAPNRHVHVDDLADLRALGDIPFDKVVFIVGHTDHYGLERERLEPGEPNAFDYHLTTLVQALEQLKHRPLRRFIAFSTVLIYDPQQPAQPVGENAPINPYRNRYVLSKYLAEEASKFYARWVPILTVRVSNLYGPTPLRRFDLIHSLVRQLLREGRGEIWSRRPERDFIHVDDAARAILALLDTDETGIINLGTGTATRVGHLVDVLQDLSGCAITDRDIAVDGPMHFRCDITKLRRVTGWEPQYSIESGLRHTFEMMKTYVS